MQCNDVQTLLIDYIDGQLAPAIREKVEQHLKICETCKEEVAQFQKLFSEMATAQLEQPGPALKENFNTMLQSEINIAATMEMLRNREEKKVVPMKSNAALLRIAASVVLVVAGVFAGMQLKNKGGADADQRLTAMNRELQFMKETMMLNLLNEESASDRIRAVGYADEMNKPDQKIIMALLETVNTDDNVNVRMAAANALAKFSGDPAVTDALISSLKKQTEPLVQIVLITILTDKKEAKAIAPIRAIISDKKTLAPVKQVAEEGLKKVI